MKGWIMDVQQNIADGKYTNKLPWPERVKSDAILRKNLNDVTDEEIQNIPALRKKFAEEKAAYDAGVKAHREEDARLEAQFRADLEEGCGIKGHPKAGRLWEIARERGHGCYSEVYIYYSELAELLQP